MPKWTVRAAIALICVASFVQAQEQLRETKASFVFNGAQIEITRGNVDGARAAAVFSTPDTTCGGPCIASMQVAPGIPTVGEMEVLDYLVNDVAGSQGLLVDARSPNQRAQGYIPGSVNLPHSTLAGDNSFHGDILRALGAREFEGVYNFTDARRLMIFDNGPSSDDAGKLVQNLLDAGYPPNKLQYYRGGMQVWALLGFSIAEEQS